MKEEKTSYIYIFFCLFKRIAYGVILRKILINIFITKKGTAMLSFKSFIDKVKMVFYSDKRVKGAKIVSLRERFDDLKARYNKGTEKEFEFTKKIEEELNQ